MPEITLDENHIYRVNGDIKPGVNEILKACGQVDFSMVPKDRLDKACELGTAVHTATALYDQGDLYEEDLHPALRGYLAAWVRFRVECEFEPELIEHRFYCEPYQYCGTLDRIGPITIPGWPVGMRVLLDLKTGNLTRSVKLQLPAYDLGIDGDSLPMIAVKLNDDGTYKIDGPMGDVQSNREAWLHCVILHRWMERNK